MKNSEVNDPLKETKDEAKEKETQHQEAPIEEQKSETADQSESSVTDAKQGIEESVVEVSEPVASEPDSSEPDSPEPVASEPDSSEPDPGPEQIDPASSEPVASEPDSSEPDPGPEQKDPVASEPDSPEPDPGPEQKDPASSEPVASESVASEPDTPEPDPDPEQKDPASSEPVASEPDSPESVASESEPDPDPEQKDPAPAVKPISPAKESAPEVLIDENEEQQKNDSYDDHVDLDDHEHKEEEVNYALLSKEDLVKMMREKLDNPGKGNIRKEVEDIKGVFNEKVAAVLEEKKKHFLDEGGNIEDFKPAEEPVEAEMKELLYKYKGLKAEFTRKLEKTKQENLLKKQEILEGFRILMENQESFEITFRNFKDLQKQWFAAGVVPHQNLKDLWDSYNYFVEKFNDYVRINRDLRALDLKKNLELKEQLCERTEALDKEPNVVQAFKVLQKNHARWREIGPVSRESRDEIWDRFKLATSVINKKHQDYHSRLKESLHENLEKKVNLCEKIEKIAATVYETHGDWVDKTNQVLEIQKTWKTIGYAPKKDNNIIYARFRTACDVFFGNKAKFYASAYEDQKENLSLKLEITVKAEALSNNQEWKETTNELIQLQKRWKEIGPVPRRDSDKLWKRFRAACDTFFNNKSKYFEDIDSTFEENLKAKKLIVAEMDAFSITRQS